MNHKFKNDDGMELEVTCLIPESADESFIGEMEKLIPMIAEAVAENLMDDYDPICMALTPDGATAILPMSQAEDSYGEMYEDFFVHDDLVILRCKSEDVATLGGQCYLLGAAIVLEIDEDGNECNIDGETVSMAMEFFEENLTDVQVDSGTYPAIRLV